MAAPAHRGSGYVLDYLEQAEVWDSAGYASPCERARREYLADAVAARRPGRVLDAGTGNGIVANPLHDRSSGDQPPADATNQLAATYSWAIDAEAVARRVSRSSGSGSSGCTG